jgi:hypothetical protein
MNDNVPLLKAGTEEMPAHHVSHLTSGSKLGAGRFEIVRRIGEGGMGVVYEAIDSQRRARVALKTLRWLDAGSIYRLKNEFRALAEVSHPNLVGLHELFADAGLWFFSMDLVEGVSFDEWVRPEGSLDEGRLRSVLPQLVDAVGAIHGTGKVHRDLKPSNVLVTKDGHIVVLDFGLACESDGGGAGQTITMDVSGTPAYMAPEQASGRQATAASDVYALGVMLFEALTGVVPFRGLSHEVLVAKQTLDAPSILVWYPDAPDDLAVLSDELLARDPAKRIDVEVLRRRLAVSTEASRATRSESSGSSHAEALVGRDAELATLREAYLASCAGDKPVIVLLSGESGIGKSALLESFLAEVRAEGRALVLSGRCYERESVPFKGFDALVDELSRYLRKLSVIELATSIPREVYALLRLFPVLGRIDAIARAPERKVGDAFEMQRRGFLALGEMLGRIRDQRPLVVAIDDLHWSDRDSTALLLHIVRQPDAPRLLFVGCHRGEGETESPVLKPLYDTLEADVRLDLRRLRLGPLSTESAALLVPEWTSEEAPGLIREAGGNPFLLREIGRAGRKAEGRSLPESLRARVTTLADVERALLEVIAVAGRPLSLEVAGDAAGVPDPRPTFDALRSSHLLRSAWQAGSVECYHDRVRESVVAALSEERLRDCHRRLAQVLLQQPDANAEHLSEHFEHAGEGELAAEYAVRSADRATRSAAFDQAARLYSKALRLGTFDVRETRRLEEALGDVLANGGYGAAAAEAFLRASEGATEAQIVELKTKAAAQYLRGARVASGCELIGEILQGFGMRLPESPGRAFATLLLERARLRVRGLTLNKAAPDRTEREWLDALYGLLQPLSRHDALSCAALNQRVLRRALIAGDARAVVLGLHIEMWARALGIGDVSRVPALSRIVEALLPRLSDPCLDAEHEFLLGFVAYCGTPDGDLDYALRCTERFLAAARANPPLFPIYDRVYAESTRAMLLAHLGHYRQLARELPALLDDSWGRDDLLTISTLLGFPLQALLVVGAQAEAERQLKRATRAWTTLGNPYSFCDFMLYWGELSLLHDRRDSRAAWELCLAHDERFRASFAKRSTLYAGGTQFLRGMTAAALAATTPSASERTALLLEAERPPVLPTSPHWRRWLLLPRAAAACARGDRERAVRLLREVDSGPRPPGLGPAHTHALRQRLGSLLGGEEGATLVAQADAFFERGTGDVDSLVATLLPGCELR